MVELDQVEVAGEAHMDISDDNVSKLPVRFKSPLPADRTLVLPYEVQRASCDHMFGVQYIIDIAQAEVECSKCHAKLNPMWVLKQLAIQDSRYYEAQQRYKEEMARLSERSRTKCDNCGKLTRISRR